jgi:hypothetical protein
MAHGHLDYEAPVIHAAGRDGVVLGVTGAYAAFNVVLMLAYAKSLLGPVPFWLIFLLLGTSGAGVIAALPVCLALRRSGVTWRAGVGAVMLFALLTLFNYWCLCAASAAV